MLANKQEDNVLFNLKILRFLCKIIAWFFLQLDMWEDYLKILSIVIRKYLAESALVSGSALMKERSGG